MDKRARRASIEGSIRARRASIEGGSTNQESPPSSSAAKKRNLGAFKEREIWNVVRYMDGNGDGSITFGELELAFRTSRRTKAASKLKGRGKKVLGRIKQLIKDLDISVHVWFEMMDSAGDSEGNGSISSMELRKGLKLLVGKRRRFTENEIVDLIRYMDPNADGDLTLEEVEIAVARSNEGDSEEVRITEENHRVLCRLEEHMKKKGIRLTDLFEEMDEGGDKIISPEELAEGLKVIADPSKRGRLNPPVMSKDRKGFNSKKVLPPKVPGQVNIKVEILDDDESLLHVREKIRLKSPVAKERKRKQERRKMEPKFLDIRDEEIELLKHQIGRLLSYPINYATLKKALYSIPQISEVLKHTEDCWTKIEEDIVKKIHDAEAGTIRIDEGNLEKIAKFLDPNNDGEIDLEELTYAFRLVRRGRVGVKRREKILDDLKNQKVVTRFDVLAEKGRVILERQAKIKEEEKSKRDFLEVRFGEERSDGF